MCCRNRSLVSTKLEVSAPQAFLFLRQGRPDRFLPGSLPLDPELRYRALRILQPAAINAYAPANKTGSLGKIVRKKVRHR
jgi:hypothetical protein